MIKLKVIVFLAIACASFLFVGCQTTPKAGDGYAETLGDFEPIILDSMMINTIEANSTELKAKSMKVVFFPEFNGIRFEFRFFSNAVQLDLTEANRIALINGMNAYLEQYKNKTLNQKNNKKKALFGKTDTAFKWGLLAPSYSTTIPLRFEYFILDQERPYFVMANASTPQKTESGKIVAGGGNSPALRIVLSPAQCVKLLELINQENLLSIVEALKTEANTFDIYEFEGEIPE